MNNNVFHNNQQIIFQSLISATICECASLEEKERRHLSIGAFDTVLSFRNFGHGIPVSRMVRLLFPLEDIASDSALPQTLRSLVFRRFTQLKI